MIELINELNGLKTDKEKLLFCQRNNDKVTITLDSDSSVITFDIDYGKLSKEEVLEKEALVDTIELYADCFIEDFGNRKGVPLLFELLGINCEPV